MCSVRVRQRRLFRSRLHLFGRRHLLPTRRRRTKIYHPVTSVDGGIHGGQGRNGGNPGKNPRTTLRLYCRWYAPPRSLRCLYWQPNVSGIHHFFLRMMMMMIHYLVPALKSWSLPIQLSGLMHVSYSRDNIFTNILKTLKTDFFIRIMRPLSIREAPRPEGTGVLPPALQISSYIHEWYCERNNGDTNYRQNEATCSWFVCSDNIFFLSICICTLLSRLFHTICFCCFTKWVAYFCILCSDWLRIRHLISK